MMPMPRRRLTSVAIRVYGQNYLFDCGEGTQVPYKELHLGLRALRVVAVSHLHADHCLGLPGLLMLRAQMPDPGPLTVLGPPGLQRFINHVRRDLVMFINYEVRVHEWTGVGGKAYSDDLVRLTWEPLAHTTFCLGYRMEEHPRPGRFDPEVANTLCIPRGPMWGELQQGRPVQLADGSTVTPSQVLGPPRRGRRVAFATDTAVTPGLERLLCNTDLAFVESMFLEEHIDDAASKKHMTAGQAATTARTAGVARLVLVHISPRYDDADLAQFEAQAAQDHPRAQVARDGLTLTLPLPD